MLKFLKSAKEFVLFLKGKSYKVTSDNKNYGVIEKMLGDGTSEDELHAVVDIAVVVKSLANGITTKGGFEILEGEVFYNKIKIPTDCAEHIIQLHETGNLDEAFVKFVELLLKNPNKDAVKDLYKFIIKGKMPITNDGRFCAYRVCTSEFKDKHSGTFDNSVGAIVTMLRANCNSNRNETCAAGLHFCSESYIGQFKGSSDRLLMVAISPEDVVAIPNDYNDAKGRCCKFEVIKEITLGAITGVGKVHIDTKVEEIIKENLTDNNGMKCCSKCKEVKLLTDFNKDSKSKSGRRSSCKICDSKAKKSSKTVTKELITKACNSVAKTKQVVSITNTINSDSGRGKPPRNTIYKVTKVCSKCKQQLPLDNFGNDKQTKDGKYSSCKECVKKSRAK